MVTIQNKKYKLTNEKTYYKYHTLHRIEALRDFGNVKKGDLGGFIENEKNLSHDGNCWVRNNAKVFGEARVWGDAQICDNAYVKDNAKVFGSAIVYDGAKISDNANVFDNARIYCRAWIFDNAKVYDNAVIFENAAVFDQAQVYENAVICSRAVVDGRACIRGNALVTCPNDYIVFKNWWSSGRHFTWTRTNNMWAVGCFYGTGENLIKKAYADSEESGQEYERVVKYVESIRRKFS